MTQGETLPPTIINVVVNSVVRNWVSVMVDQVGGQDWHGWEGRHQSTLFYMDDSMVASLDRGWLQEDFSILILFDWVGLGNNVKKTVRMVFRPCQAVRTQLEASHERHMTGAGLS